MLLEEYKYIYDFIVNGMKIGGGTRSGRGVYAREEVIFWKVSSSMVPILYKYVTKLWIKIMISCGSKLTMIDCSILPTLTLWVEMKVS